MWVSDPCRSLLFIAISINTDLHTAGFTQCCVSCKLKRFYLCYGLEVASASSKVKIEMKESSARANGDPATRQTVELGKRCSDSSRGQGLQCYFCI